MPIIKILGSLFIFLILSNISFAATYYVRTDGSTSTNCTGLANAAYDGSGTGEACAFNHPFYAIGWWTSDGAGGTAGIMSGTDDVIISCNGSADCTGVTFNTGYSSTFSCTAPGSFGCYMRPIPDGTNGDHTTIKGCSSTGCSSASMRPGFTGKGGNYMNVNLQSSDYVDIEDIDVYDTGSYGSGHATYDADKGDSASNSVKDNVVITNATNISLKDMKIWGAYRYGLFGGGGSNFTFDNVDISYNSLAGWDTDSCSGAGTCGVGGTITFKLGWKIDYNGCVATSSYGTIAAGGCYSQDQGGFGDGLGAADTGGTWAFTDGSASHNTSDGIDLLYLNRGSYSGGTFSFKRSKAEGNAGNQVKGPNNIYLEDNIILGNCGYFNGQTFTCSSGTCGASFNNCRAFGAPIAIAWRNNSSVTPEIYNNTISGNGTAIIGIEGPNSSVCPTGTDILVKNNTFIGGREWLEDTTFNGGGSNRNVRFFYNSAKGDYGTLCDPEVISDYNVCSGEFVTNLDCNDTVASPHIVTPGANNVYVTLSADVHAGTITQGPVTYYSASDYATQVSLKSTSSARDLSDEAVSGADSFDYNSASRGASWDAGALEFDTTNPINGTKKWYGIMQGNL